MSDTPSPTQSVSPTTSTQRKERHAVPTEHKKVLKYIMFIEDDGKMNKTYQKGLKKKGDSSMAGFWQVVSNKLNTRVQPQEPYSNEVMICRILMKVYDLINSPLLHWYFQNSGFNVMFPL